MQPDSLDLLERLRRAPVLRHLPLATLDRLASQCSVRDLVSGEQLIAEGKSDRGVFLVLEGRVAVRRRIGAREESLIAIRESGEWVGELAFADAGPRLASVRAEGAAQVLDASRETFLEAISGSPDASLDLLRLVTSRLRESDADRLELLRKKNDELVSTNQRLNRENSRLRAEVDDTRGLERFLGASAEARGVRAAVRRAAPSEVPALIIGETGTGKELLARALHEGGETRTGAFVAMNCGLFSEALLESELFGHARGAFTGAVASRRGLVEAADGGTLFLDEVADMPRSLQSALLRFLELGEFRRVGETQVRHARCRIVAASPIELEEAVARGHFRSDLRYRLDVLSIRIPPLRERRDDIPLLVAHLLETVAARLAVTPLVMAPDALEALGAYPFPGNVRELENEIERLHVALEPGTRVRREHLSSRVRGGAASASQGYAGSVRSYKIQLLGEAIREADGNLNQAARRLGLHRSNLVRMVRDLGIPTDAPSPRGASRSSGS